MQRYRSRLVDSELKAALGSAGAVVIDGARAVGKTESARQVARSELRLDSQEPRAVLARDQPATALTGQTPRLLDEYQVVPALWNEVRRAVDDRGAPGQFVLTGSAVPDDDGLRHPGAGRFRHVMMRPMTFAESGHSSSAISLSGLFAGQVDLAEPSIDFAQVVERIVVGGWPGWSDRGEAAALAQAQAYVDDIAQHDFVALAGVRRDPRRLVAYLRALAAMTAQPASMATIGRRMKEVANLEIGETAASVAHAWAQRLFLVEDQPAWSPRLRSRTPSTQTPTRHLADPSLAAALLGSTTARLLAEPETLGHLFESQVIHDLRVYAQSCGARGVYHYRDMKGRDEMDAVVENADGAWLGIEVKLSQARVNEAAKNLLRVAAKVERSPAGLVVVTPDGVAHRRTDGVLVVPLTVLGA